MDSEFEEILSDWPKLADTMEDILNSDEPEPFQKAAYRLVSNRLKGLDAPSGLHQVQELRKEHLLSDDERQRLRVAEAAEDSEDFVEGFKNEAKSILSTVESGNLDNAPSKELDSRLENGATIFHEGIKENINAAKNAEPTGVG